MRSLTLSTLILTLGLVACGGGGADSGDMSPDEAKAAAREAFDDGNYADAEKHYTNALDGVAKDDSGYLELKVEHLQALSHVNGEKALEQVKELKDQLKADQFRKVGLDLFSGGAYVEAAHVMDLGNKAYPDDEQMVSFTEKMVEQIKEKGGEEGASALAGLGYF